MSSKLKSTDLIEPPLRSSQTFLDFPLVTNLNTFDADIAILGIPYGIPYFVEEMGSDTCRGPDAIRQYAGMEDLAYKREHYDFDFHGPLLDNRDVKVVDCGNVTADPNDHGQHYLRAENAARIIFGKGATLIALGGDHGIPIPVLRALEVFNTKVTLVQVDAHLDWLDEKNGVRDGYSSPVRRASEMPWIGEIVQIGLRGPGSACEQEVQDALSYGAKLIDAYEMHAIGIDAVLDQIPDGDPYYITIDADGIDPTIMPGVMAQSPGGLTWVQIRALIHGLTKKGRVLGMDLVEVAPILDVGNTTLIHAERLLCNFIGACVRAGYYD